MPIPPLSIAKISQPLMLLPTIHAVSLLALLPCAILADPSYMNELAPRSCPQMLECRDCGPPGNVKSVKTKGSESQTTTLCNGTENNGCACDGNPASALPSPVPLGKYNYGSGGMHLVERMPKDENAVAPSRAGCFGLEVMLYDSHPKDKDANLIQHITGILLCPEDADGTKHPVTVQVDIPGVMTFTFRKTKDDPIDISYIFGDLKQEWPTDDRGEDHQSNMGKAANNGWQSGKREGDMGFKLPAWVPPSSSMMTKRSGSPPSSISDDCYETSTASRIMPTNAKKRRG